MFLLVQNHYNYMTFEKNVKKREDKRLYTGTIWEKSLDELHKYDDLDIFQRFKSVAITRLQKGYKKKHQKSHK